jgi:uncharacterized protein
MNIDVRNIPAEGILLSGEEDAAYLDSQDGAIRSAAPLRYHLQATIQEDELVLEGWLEAAFDLRCDRCLEPFRKTVRLDPYILMEIVDNLAPDDLTNRLRDDILLDLPGYPKCEDADTPRECPAFAAVPPESEFQQIEAPETGKTVWEALNGIDPDPDKADEANKSDKESQS